MSEPGIGHNSDLGEDGIAVPPSGDKLLAFIERIERLEEEKSSIQDDIKEIYGEAKGTGFDTKVMRQIVALRKLDPADRKSRMAIMDVYLQALGMY